MARILEVDGKLVSDIFIEKMYGHLDVVIAKMNDCDEADYNFYVGLHNGILSGIALMTELSNGS